MKLQNIFKSQEVLIKEIHDEFDSAQDRLLSEARRILESSSLTHNEKIEAMAQRLKSVGFTKTEIVRKADEIQQKRQKTQKHLDITREQAELIEYYKFNYPMMKFLTESELDRICTKYGLIYASTESYIKDVPEKNLRDIENAQKLKNVDIAPSEYEDTYKIYNWSSSFRDKYYNPSDIPSRLRRRFISKNILRYGYEIMNELLRQANLTSKIVHLDDIHENIIDRSGLFIAAPKFHFDLKGKKKKGLGYFNISITEVKDPIVFRYVRGGVQVLTKWGLEAEDPALLVEKMN